MALMPPTKAGVVVDGGGAEVSIEATTPLRAWAALPAGQHPSTASDQGGPSTVCARDPKASDALPASTHPLTTLFAMWSGICVGIALVACASIIAAIWLACSASFCSPRARSSSTAWISDATSFSALRKKAKVAFDSGLHGENHVKSESLANNHARAISVSADQTLARSKVASSECYRPDVKHLDHFGFAQHSG